MPCSRMLPMTNEVILIESYSCREPKNGWKFYSIYRGQPENIEAWLLNLEREQVYFNFRAYSWKRDCLVARESKST